MSADARLVQLPVNQLFTDDGTPGGSSNMAVDGSVTPVTFFVQPPSDEIWRVLHIFLIIEDTGLYRPDNYGAIGALTNGIVSAVRTGTSPLVTGAFPIQTNADWDLFSSRFEVREGTGATLALVSRIDTGEQNPTRLDGSLNRNLAVTINDDLTGLTDHRAVASGVIENQFL